MEFFRRRKKEVLLDKNFLLHQRNTELDVMRDILGKMAENNMDVGFMTGAIRNLGNLPFHEDRSLQFVVSDLEDTAARHGHDDAELLEQLALLRSANAISVLKLTLTDSGLSEKEKTEFKEDAQMLMYDASVDMSDDEFDLLLNYLDEITPNIVGVDFNDEKSIAATKKVVESRI